MELGRGSALRLQSLLLEEIQQGRGFEKPVLLFPQDLVYKIAVEAGLQLGRSRFLLISPAGSTGHDPAGASAVDPAVRAVHPGFSRGGADAQFIDAPASGFPAALFKFPAIPFVHA